MRNDSKRGSRGSELSDCIRENFYATPSAFFSHEALQCVIAVMGAERVMFAVDAPLDSSTKAAQFIESAPISNEHREMICHVNASRLFDIALD